MRCEEIVGLRKSVSSSWAQIFCRTKKPQSGPIIKVGGESSKSEVEECSQNSQYLQFLSYLQLPLQQRSFLLLITRHSPNPSTQQKWRRNFTYLQDCPRRHFNLLLLLLPPRSPRSLLSPTPSSEMEEVTTLFLFSIFWCGVFRKIYQLTHFQTSNCCN